MYNFEDLKSNTEEKVIYVDKNNPYFDKFINLLTENKCRWYSGDSPQKLVYDKTYYTIDDNNHIGYLKKEQLKGNSTIVYLNEIEYEEQKNIDIDIEVFL